MENVKSLSPKMNILIVDDDESMRTVIGKKLFQLGYNISTAVNGSHAIQIIQSGKKFCLVLCDLKMQLKGGIELLQYIKDNFIETSVIVMTGYPEKERVVAAAQLGVQDILLKPFKMPDLIRIIEVKLAVKAIPTQV
jgi:two-component system, NtrC family, response regulator HydG